MKDMVSTANDRLCDASAAMLVRKKGTMTAKRVLCLICALIMAVGMMGVGGFAAEDVSQNAIVTGVNSFVNNMYAIIKYIAGPIAGLVAAWSLLMWLVIADEKDTSKYKRRFLIAALCLAGIFLAPSLVNSIIGWFNQDSGKELTDIITNN